MSLQDVIPSADAQCGRTCWLLYCSDRKSDIAGTSRVCSLRTTGMERCVQLLETSIRGGLCTSRIYLTGKVMSQVWHKWVMLWTESVAGGSHEPACYWTSSATLKVDPSVAFRICASMTLGKLVMLPSLSVLLTNVIIVWVHQYPPQGWALVWPSTVSRG